MSRRPEHATSPATAPPAGRWRGGVYVAVAMLCYAVSWTLLILRAEIGEPQRVDPVTGNGFAYYAYLPSIFRDGDLDLSNQALDWSGKEAGGWMLSGRYPIGVSLTLLPSFLCAHSISTLAYSLTGAEALAPNGFTIIYQLLNVAFVMAFWTAAMIMLDRMILRRYRLHGHSVMAGLLTYWLGSCFLWYFLLDPFWAHVLSAAWVVIVVCLVEGIIRTLDEGRFLWWQWPLLAFAMSMAVLCRLSDVFLVPLFVYLACRIACSGFLLRAAAVVPLVVVAMFPIAIQLVIWGSVHGAPSELSPTAIGYSEVERFHWTQPVIFRMLFSSLNGLFFWSPILLAGVWGLAWRTVGCRGWRDPLLASLLLSAAVLCYLNGSWYGWFFGQALGARAFLDAGVVFALGLAFAFEHLRGFRRGPRAAVIGLLVLAVGTGYALMALRHFNDAWRPQNDYLFEWERRLYDGLSR